MDILQTSVDSLSAASIYLLAALGLSLTFGMMNVINFAHGEFMMIGAYVSYVMSKFYGGNVGFFQEISILLTALVVAGAFGFFIEKIFVRHLYGKPEYSILATMGLSLILQQLVRNIFGANNVDVPMPEFLSQPLDMGFAKLSSPRIFILAVAISVAILIFFLIKNTRAGRAMRATIQDRAMASCMGVNTFGIDALTFALGSAIAGLAGSCLALLGSIGPMVGQNYIVLAFLVVILGGVGSILGTILGALFIGIATPFFELFTTSSVGRVLVFVLVVLLLQLKPKGLFALKTRHLND